jgi:hypothetical protein
LVLELLSNRCVVVDKADAHIIKLCHYDLLVLSIRGSNLRLK